MAKFKAPPVNGSAVRRERYHTVATSNACALVASAAVAAAAFLSGCAAIDTYRACGLSGCAGDADITAKVEAQFASYPALQPPNLIHVQTRGRVVYLTGLVSTPLMRELAGTVASHVPGVPKVVNSVGVEDPGK